MNEYKKSEDWLQEGSGKNCSGRVQTGKSLACCWKDGKTVSRRKQRDFPGGPVVKTSPSNIGGAGLIPGREAKIPHALQPKSQGGSRETPKAGVC